MADLPDYYTQTAISEAEAASFDGGLAANRPDDPVSRDIYLGTDNQVLYVCFTDGTWTGFNAAMLTMGILTLYENMVANSKKITGLADPTAAQDAATRAYVLNRVALRLALTGGTMSGNIIMGGNKVTGLGAPLVQDQALRYNRAEIRNAEIAAAAAIVYSKLNLTGLIRNADIKSDAAIAVSKLVNTYFPETLMSAQGDLLIRGASNPERLAKITTGQFLKATATGYEGVAIPSPLTVAETEVFNGTSPTSWADLNLGGTVGPQVTLVLLKVFYPDTNYGLAVRRNGDTDEHYGSIAKAGGTALAAGSATVFAELVVTTDASGVIEWKTGNAVGSTTIDVIAYIK